MDSSNFSVIPSIQEMQGSLTFLGIQASRTLFILASISTFLLAVWIKSIFSRPKAPLPPGPPADPVIGHLRVIPTTGQAKVFYEWSKIYGDVIHLHSFGRSIVVLNSNEAAIELLDKRGANYSDRPKMLILELMGWFPTLAFLGAGKLFLRHRKMFQHHFGPRESMTHLPIQRRQAHLLCKSLMLDTPTNTEHTEHVSRYAKAIVLEVAFGQPINSAEDEFYKFGKEITASSTGAGPIGSTPVDFIPILQHFPAWFPGAYYGARAKSMYPLIRRFHDYPVERMRKQMAEGTANPCFLRTELEHYPTTENDNSEDMIVVKGVATEIYAAGADTTFTAMHLFVLTMVLNPDCMRKAQEELDRVVGLDRLPEYSDRTLMPYIEGIVQETLRWQPSLELGIPHRSLEDDIYRGMFIPKGSTVIANTRAITLDEKIYADPLKYDPTRYMPAPLGRGEPYPTASWGFGRRICPGRHLAHASLWLGIATMLSTLDFSKVAGKDGKAIAPKVEFTTGLTQEQVPFPCVIRARSERAKGLILSACAA
ncbi:cytochrome P450, partial [Gymnopus androsaceus JB14]